MYESVKSEVVLKKILDKKLSVQPTDFMDIVQNDSKLCCCYYYYLALVAVELAL